MKITLILLAILLVGTITAGVTIIQLSKDMTFDKEIKDSLTDIGIGKFEVRNETCIEYDLNTSECLKTDNTLLGYSQPVVSKCKIIDEYLCKSHIYQEKGINKDIEIITKYCLNYSEPFEVKNETKVECINWKVLTEKEIETEIENKVKELLTNIAEINIDRNKIKTETEILEEYKIEIK